MLVGPEIALRPYFQFLLNGLGFGAKTLIQVFDVGGSRVLKVSICLGVCCCRIDRGGGNWYLWWIFRATEEWHQCNSRLGSGGVEPSRLLQWYEQDFYFSIVNRSFE